VLCPACPQPGRNLPADWDNVPLHMKYVLYSHFFTMVHAHIRTGGSMDCFLLLMRIFDCAAETSPPSKRIQASVTAGHILWNSLVSRRYSKLPALRYKR